MTTLTEAREQAWRALGAYTDPTPYSDAVVIIQLAEALRAMLRATA